MTDPIAIENPATQIGASENGGLVAISGVTWSHVDA